MMRTLLCSRWSPELIALTLAPLYPKGHKLRVSHETIYNFIYALPVATSSMQGVLVCPPV
jgi:IS30 family transposase